MTLVDTHCHIQEADYPLDREQTLQAAIEAGVTKVLVVGTDMKSSVDAVKFARERENVWAIVGVHPHETKHGIDGLAELATEPKVVGIGEIGLDYYYDDSAPRELQRKRFIEQLDLARRVDLPVIIHDRDAHGDMLDIFHNEGKGLRGVFHCYSGSLETAKELLKMGFYLGFGGSSTFKNAEKVRSVLKYVPEDRILFETDSPYLTPVPYRGKRNNPAYTLLVAQNAALVRGAAVDTLIEKSTENVKKLFEKII